MASIFNCLTLLKHVTQSLRNVKWILFSFVRKPPIYSPTFRHVSSQESTPEISVLLRWYDALFQRNLHLLNAYLPLTMDSISDKHYL